MQESLSTAEGRASELENMETESRRTEVYWWTVEDNLRRIAAEGVPYSWTIINIAALLAN